VPNPTYEPHATPPAVPNERPRWQVTAIEPGATADDVPKVSRYGTFADAAEALRITPQHVRALCESKTVGKGKFKGWTFLSPTVARLERGREDRELFSPRGGREIRVIYPNGEIEVFPSVREAATALNVTPQGLHPYLSKGKTWKRGARKGVRVEYADEQGVEAQARFAGKRKEAQEDA
jgi:hypothetical protein